MMREYHVRICERLGVKLPGPTRHDRPICALAGRGSYALDSRRWGTERSLSPVIVSYATDSGRHPIAAVTRPPDPGCVKTLAAGICAQ